MNPIEAAQHIYGNVEAEQSPRKRGGFQTLFYTQGLLTEAEIEELESHLVYFEPQANPAKRIFFSLGSGKVVVGQIVPLAGADRLGRQGRYLAHSLVFSQEAFAELGANPFAVFAQYQFVTTVEEAWRVGDGQTGHVPVARLERPVEARIVEVQAAGQWPAVELRKLVFLAMRADALARQRATVAFVGPPTAIEQALAAAFSALPTKLQPTCSFDTHFAGCNPVALYYWAVGFGERPTSGRFTTVDAEQKVVDFSHEVQEALGPTAPRTAYERWVDQRLAKGDLEFIAQHRDAAYGLCQWLETGQGLPEQGAFSPEVVESVFKANAAVVRERVKAKLGAQVPAPLAERVLEAVLTQTSPPQLLEKLQGQFPLPELLETLWSVYAARGFAAPDGPELRALGILLARADHRELKQLYLCWAGNRKDLQEYLLKASDEDYRQFLQTALRHRLVEPLALLVPGKGASFVELYLAACPERYLHLSGLIEALLASREAAALTKVSPLLPRRGSNELRKVARLIRGQPAVPADFARALEAALMAAQAQEPKSVLQSLRRRLFGL